MQVTRKMEVRLLVRTSCLVLFVAFLATSVGCQRLGVAVAQILPAKKAKAAAPAPTDETEEQAGNTANASGDLAGNMDGGPSATPDFDDPNADLAGDTQNYGNREDMESPEGDSVFDGVSGQGAMEAEQLDDGPPEDFTGSLVGDYTGGASADPAAGAVTGSPTGDTAGDPSLTPGATNQGNAGSGNRKQSGSRRGKLNGQQNSAAQLRKLKVQPPPPKPVYRLTENSVLPVMTKEGQRVGFSVRYQLQKGEMSPRSQYALVIESAKSGKFGLPARLGEEGILQVPAVPAFRPNSGPFKASLIEITSRGPQPISNEIKFHPKF